MATVLYPCGCIVQSSMFGEREIVNVLFCVEHAHLASPDKTLRQMAQEILAAQPQPESESDAGARGD